MTAGAVVSLLYVLAAPVFSAFRLELVVRADGRLRACARRRARSSERLSAPSERRRRSRAPARAGARDSGATRSRHMARSSLNFGALPGERRHRDKRACTGSDAGRVSCGRQRPTPSGSGDGDPVVAARCARGARHRRGARPARRLARRRPATPDQIGAVERAGRVAARRRAHVARADGQVFALDGFDDGPELRAALGSGDRDVHAGPVRTQPLLRAATSSSPTAARCSSAATSTRTRASPTRRSSTRRRTRTSAGRTCRSAAGIRPRRSCPTGAC